MGPSSRHSSSSSSSSSSNSHLAVGVAIMCVLTVVATVVFVAGLYFQKKRAAQYRAMQHPVRLVELCMDEPKIA